MWFCCQLWQCNIRACLGPLDVWKAWNGWSHVVHPCRASAAPTTFLDARPRVVESEKVAVPAAMEPVHSPRRSISDPLGNVMLEHGSRGEVTVEIHSSTSGAAPLAAGGGRASSGTGGGTSTASIPSSGSGRLSFASTSSGSSIASSDCPLVPAAQHARKGTARVYIQDELSGVISPLGVLLEWEAEDEDDEDEATGDADDGEDTTPSPRRAPSTDWTQLESSLDFWRHEHIRRPFTRDEDERRSKVRYNDTGSLEEVNMEQMVEYYVDDDLSLSPDVDHENLKMQYRQIWELRATLEEDEELSDAARPLSTEEEASKNSDEEVEEGLDAESQISRSSPDQSPEVEFPTSHTTSFESNTESLLEEVCCGRWVATTGSGAALQLPTYETRRQTFRNVLGWRLHRLEARRYAAAMAAATGCQPSVEDTSFDSVDTVDTEGSSTDASRLEQEQATTSFESTIDHTQMTDDSAGDASHRLQQLRADSGYRSLEQAPAPASAVLTHAPPRLSIRQLPIADSTELELIRDPRPPRLPSLGDSGSADGGKVARLALGVAEEELDEGVAGLTSPPGEALPLQPPLPPQPLGASERRRTCTRSASKKRREFGGGHGAVTALAWDAEPPPPPSSSQPLLHRCHAVHTRDYSVDEKSDALFREFSRCEPMPGDSLRPRLSAAAHRRHHQHHRHTHLSASAYPYARKAAAASLAAAAAAAAVPSPTLAAAVADKALVLPPGPGIAADTTTAAAASSMVPVIRVAPDDAPERMF